MNRRNVRDFSLRLATAMVLSESLRCGLVQSVVLTIKPGEAPKAFRNTVNMEPTDDVKANENRIIVLFSGLAALSAFEKKGLRPTDQSSDISQAFILADKIADLTKPGWREERSGRNDASQDVCDALLNRAHDLCVQHEERINYLAELLVQRGVIVAGEHDIPVAA